METSFEKEFIVEDGQIKVTKTATIVTEASFNLSSLYKQKEAIQAQQERDNAQRDKELAEVNELIEEAEDAGLELPVTEA